MNDFYLIRKHLICLFVASISICPIKAQRAHVFDPLLDPRASVIKQPDAEQWQSTYMWYPGLLSAHLQRIQKKASYERCVNVNYPGNFFKDSNRSLFRKKVRLKKDTQITWVAPAVTSLKIDGREVRPQENSMIVSSGAHTLLFEVSTEEALPALIIQGEEVEKIEGWQVSLDGQFWNIPETDARFNKPSVRPDMPEEIKVRYQPVSYTFFRNSRQTADSRFSLGRGGKLIVDFSHLEVGEVVLTAKGIGKLMFSVGESPEEVIDEQTVRTFTRQGHSGDGLGEMKMYLYEQKKIDPIELTSREQVVRLPVMAVRYLKIESEYEAMVSDIHFEAQVWPVDFLLQFESDNSDINDLFNAGVATLHTSMHNFYLDGVKRDFLPWAMDAVISSLGGDYVFGDSQVSRNGLSLSLMPQNPTASDWGIVDYPLHALIGLKHYYLRYGDVNTLFMFRDRIEQQMALYESVQDEKGFISSTQPQSGFIPGWSKDMGPDQYGTPCYAQIMLYQNFKNAAFFAALWKDAKRVKHYTQKAESLKNNILTCFWDEHRKAFINGYKPDGTKDDRISHHAQYWSVLTDLYPADDYDALFEQVIPAIYNYKENVSYEKGYEMLAYIKAGKIPAMFALLDEVWGDWLRQGNTRFPENFMPKAPLKKQLEFYSRPFGLSLCHGANGVPPIVAVLHGIYGFSQSAVRPDEYTLAPSLYQMTKAKGRIPIKEGFIELDLVKNGMSAVIIPAGCKVTLLHAKGGPVVLKKAGTYRFEIN